MLVRNIIKVLLLLLGGVFIMLQGLQHDVVGAAVSAFMFSLLTFLYYYSKGGKTSYFFWFLAFFSVAQIQSFMSYFGPEYSADDIDIFYYGTNILYIISYLILIAKIFNVLNIKTILAKFSGPLFILIVLDIFCVTLVTATTEGVLSIYEYTLEFIYNAVIMVLLSVALINYMYRNDTKSILFLVASILIVFSEIIQLAYYYILDDNFLGYIYSFFLVLAFIFFYEQSQMKFADPEPDFFDENIETNSESKDLQRL